MSSDTYSSAETSHSFPWPSLVAGLAATLLLLATALTQPARVAIGAMFLSVALAVALGAAWLRWGTPFSMMGVFFVIAAAHAVFGFVTAQPSSETIWMETFFEDAYEQAFLIVSFGLFAAATGYAAAVMRSPKGWESAWSLAEADTSKLLVASRWGVVIGTAIMFFVSLKLGYAPILASTPGVARYLTQALTDDFRQYEWLLNRAMDLLTYCLPLLMMPGLAHRRRIDSFLAMVGSAALLVPLRRANILSLLFMLLLCSFLRNRRRAMVYIAILPVFAIVYFASQIVFLDVLGLDWDQGTLISIAGSALPEVRDLGWMTSLMDGEKLNGATLIQPFVMLPSFISDYSQTHSLRAITTRMIGLDAEGQTGGLRLTLAGEGYLNFGYLGVLGVMFVFGVLTGYLDRALHAVRRSLTVPSIYVATLGTVWLGFWLYLAGTQAAATIKVGMAMIVVILWYAGFRLQKGVVQSSGLASRA